MSLKLFVFPPSTVRQKETSKLTVTFTEQRTEGQEYPWKHFLPSSTSNLPPKSMQI